MLGNAGSRTCAAEGEARHVWQRGPFNTSFVGLLDCSWMTPCSTPFKKCWKVRSQRQGEDVILLYVNPCLGFQVVSKVPYL